MATGTLKENPVRILRKALAMTQHRFADELACSYSSVQGYEGGRNVPKPMLDKMIAIARTRRLAGLADELSKWNGEPASDSPSPWGYAPKNKRMHDMLEAILESGDQRVVDAIGANLPIFFAWVAEAPPPRSTKARTKS
jgi:transcriptional regulator with XRE-family HTH domain